MIESFYLYHWPDLALESFWKLHSKWEVTIYTMINDEFRPHPPKQVETFVDLSVFFFRIHGLRFANQHHAPGDSEIGSCLCPEVVSTASWCRLMFFFLEERQAVGFLLMEDIWFCSTWYTSWSMYINHIGRLALDKLAYLVQDFPYFPHVEKRPPSVVSWWTTATERAPQLAWWNPVGHTAHWKTKMCIR